MVKIEQLLLNLYTLVNLKRNNKEITPIHESKYLNIYIECSLDKLEGKNIYDCSK